MALALYRKYRPRTFAEVIGQEHVTEPLSQALRSGRLNHAYLFSGPRGCGKTSSARILARSLNCEQGPTPEPCGVCASCKSLANDGAGSIDVVEIDAASHGGVDDARDLREKAFFAPASSRFKIYVIDEAHMISSAGFNALLKLVEEPPDYVKFIFATTEPEKVLGTIRSRTHHYPFRLIPPATLRPYLQQLTEAEGIHVEPAVFPLVVRAGAGSARDSLSVLDQLISGAGPEGVSYARAVSLLGVTDVALIDEMCDALAAGDGAAAYQTIDRVAEAGHDARRFASDLLERFRDLIILQQIPDAVTKGLVDGPADQLEQMGAQATRLGPATLSRCADIVHNGLIEMRGTTAPRLLLELITARMLLPAADESSNALLQRVERMERRLTLTPDDVGSQPASPQESPTAPAAASGGSGGISAARAAAAAASRRAPAQPASGVRGPTAQTSAPGAPAPAPAAQPAPAPAPAESAAPVSAPGGSAGQVSGDGGSAAPTSSLPGSAASVSVVPDSSASGAPASGARIPDSVTPAPVSSAPGAAAPVSAAPTSADPVSAPSVAGGTGFGSASSTGAPVEEPDGDWHDQEPEDWDGDFESLPAVRPVSSAAPAAGAAAAPPDQRAPAARRPESATPQSQPIAQQPQSPARPPEPAGLMPDAPEEPGVPSSLGAPGQLTVASIREVWPEIMTAVGRKSKKIAALAQGATVRELEGQTVVLTFRFPAHAKMVAAEPGMISDALYEALGGRWQIRCDVAGESGPSQGRGPAPRGPQGNGGGPAQSGPPPANTPEPPAPAQSRAGGGAATRQRDPAAQASSSPAADDDSDGWPEPARPGGSASRATATATPAAEAEEEDDGGAWPEPARLGGPAPSGESTGHATSVSNGPVRPTASPGEPGQAGTSAGGALAGDATPGLTGHGGVAPAGSGPAGATPGGAGQGGATPGGAGQGGAASGASGQGGAASSGPGQGGAASGGLGQGGAASGGPGQGGAASAGSGQGGATPGHGGGNELGRSGPGGGGEPAGSPASSPGPAGSAPGGNGGGSAGGSPSNGGDTAQRPRNAAPKSGIAAARLAAAGGRAGAAKAGAAKAANGSARSDTTAEEAPYDPEYDGPPRAANGRPGAKPNDNPAYQGFDPGDEPLDDVIDEKTARQSTEQQAVQLLRDLLGAEKISES